jgi:hypothetical protein
MEASTGMEQLHRRLADERARASAASAEREQASAVADAVQNELARTEGLIRSLSGDGSAAAPGEAAAALPIGERTGASPQPEPPPGMTLLQQLAWRKRRQQQQQQRQRQEHQGASPLGAEQPLSAGSAPTRWPAAATGPDDATLLVEQATSAAWTEEYPLCDVDIIHALFDGLLGPDDDAVHPEAEECAEKIKFLAVISNCGAFGSSLAEQWAQLRDYATVAARVAALAQRTASRREDLETLVAWHGPLPDLHALLAARNNTAEDEAEALRRLETQSYQRSASQSSAMGGIFRTPSADCSRSTRGLGSSRSLGSSTSISSGSSTNSLAGGGGGAPFKVGWLKKKGGGASRNFRKGGRRTWKTRRFELDNPLLVAGTCAYVQASKQASRVSSLAEFFNRAAQNESVDFPWLVPVQQIRHR